MIGLMDRLNVFSAKTTFIIVAILMPIMILSALGSGLVGLAGINPENHGKVMVFRIGNDEAYIVQMIFIYVIAPLCVLAVILAGLNFKFKNALLNRSLFFTSLFLVGWLFFASWALNVKFVAPSDASNQTQDDEGLRIRSIDLN